MGDICSHEPWKTRHSNLYHGNSCTGKTVSFNTLRLKQDGCYFADDVLKCIFLNENVWISLKIPLKFVPKGPINNIPALVQIMAWRRPGDKPLSEPMLVFLPTHICVTRPHELMGLAPGHRYPSPTLFVTMSKWKTNMHLYVMLFLNIWMLKVLGIHCWRWQKYCNVT